MQISEYPYTSWMRISRRDARRVNALAHTLPNGLGATTRAAGALLGAEVHVRSCPVELRPASEAAQAFAGPRLAVVLELTAGARAAQFAVEVNYALAATVLDRLLGGDGDTADVALEPPSELQRGLLAYLAARLSSPTADLCLAAVDDPPRAWLDSLGEDVCAVWPLAVTVDAFSCPLRVWLGPAVLALLAPSRALAADATWLDALRLPLDAITARTTLSAQELSDLEPGDVLVPEQITLEHAAEDAAVWEGEVELAIPGSRRCRFRCRASGCSLTVEHREVRALTDAPSVATSAPRSAPAPRSPPMSETNHNSPSPEDGLTLADDAPVELEICLARFSLRLDQLAALKPGQVLDTGCPIGTQVTLRAGGHAVAEGELVDVEGDIGVRILRLARREPSPGRRTSGNGEGEK